MRILRGALSGHPLQDILYVQQPAKGASESSATGDTERWGYYAYKEELAVRCLICAGTGRTPLSHLRRDRAHPCHICAGTGRTPLPHLRRDRQGRAAAHAERGPGAASDLATLRRHCAVALQALFSSLDARGVRESTLQVARTHAHAHTRTQARAHTHTHMHTHTHFHTHAGKRALARPPGSRVVTQSSRLGRRRRPPARPRARLGLAAVG